MSQARTPLAELTQDQIKSFGKLLAPFRLEFRGKILCAVDPNGEVIIKGLLRYSGQKDNAQKVLDSLNLIHNRAQVALFGRSSTEVITTFFRQCVDLPDEVLEVAATLIRDQIPTSNRTSKDSGRVLTLVGDLCRYRPQLILDCLKRAQAVIALDDKGLMPSVAKTQQTKSAKSQGNSVAKTQQENLGLSLATPTWDRSNFRPTRL